jgi:hypothetical protein
VSFLWFDFTIASGRLPDRPGGRHTTRADDGMVLLDTRRKAGECGRTLPG